MKMLSNKTPALIGLGVVTEGIGAMAYTLYLATCSSLELAQRIVRTQKVLRIIARTDFKFERARSVHCLGFAARSSNAMNA